MKKTIKIFCRADGNKELGMGDIVCLKNIVHYFLKIDSKIKYEFIVKNYNATIKYLTQDNISYITFDQNNSIEQEISFIKNILKKNSEFLIIFIVLLNNYNINKYYNLHAHNVKILCIDFFGYANCFDCVINWNINSSKFYLKRNNIFTNINIVPVSPIIEYYKEKYNFTPTINKILITCGGSDNFNITLKLLKILAKLIQKTKDVFEVFILIGHANQNIQTINDFLSLTDLKVKIFEKSNNPYSIMKNADMAIASGGLTSFELLHLGVPTLLITSYEHEVQRCEFFKNNLIADFVGLNSNISEEYLLNKIEKFISNSIMRKKIHIKSKKFFSFKNKIDMYSDIYELFANNLQMENVCK